MGREKIIVDAAFIDLSKMDPAVPKPQRVRFLFFSYSNRWIGLCLSLGSRCKIIMEIYKYESI